MNILVTGSVKGIGNNIARMFLYYGYDVYGFDREDMPFNHERYHHYKLDIGKDELPDLPDMDVIVNNAGSLIEEEALTGKLLGAYRVTEKYAFQSKIMSVINISSNSAHYGIEFPLYCMANGGMIAYTKNLARRLAQYGATVNSISPGYVDTSLDQHVKDAGLSDKIVNQCLLKHVISTHEIAHLVYYLAISNKSITGQDILVDCGECLNSEFIETPENIEKFYRSNLK